jgi:hypothetical protein
LDARPLTIGPPEVNPDRKVSHTEFLDEYGVHWVRAHEGHYINMDGPFYHLEEPTPQDLERASWPDP